MFTEVYIKRDLITCQVIFTLFFTVLLYSSDKLYYLPNNTLICTQNLNVIVIVVFDFVYLLKITIHGECKPDLGCQNKFTFSQL